MIKISKNIKDEEKLQDLFDEVDQVLNKRGELNDRYLRGITSTDMVTGNQVQVFFEKFITDLASGYLSGEIVYNAEIVDSSEEPAYRLLHPSHTDPLDPDTAAQLKYIITTLSSKNDDPKVLKALFHDAVLYGAAYERELDLVNLPNQDDNSISSSSTTSTDPNYVYYPLSALNTVAVFSTDISDISQQKPIGIITRYVQSARNSEDNQEHTLYYCVECNPYTNYYGTSIYDKTTSQDETSQYANVITLREEKEAQHDIPTFSVYEPDPQISIIDPLIPLIQSYEDIMNNLNNMYNYNDKDAKLKISGYRPENPLTMPNPAYDPTAAVSSSNPEKILNPARELEDQYLLDSKTFFVQEGGDVSWLLKEINATDATSYLKYYVDSIFQVSGIPNTNDLAFNSGDMNASAIDRKFYTMALMLDDVKQGVTTLIKHRWANFFRRINLISQTNTHYNIDDITISIGTNLPSMTDENINQQLALNGIISQKTLLSNLGYDYATEKKNKEEETEIPYETVTPDTPYVSPNDYDRASSSQTTSNQPQNSSQNSRQNSNQITDRTDNIQNIQPREGRPNK